MAATLPVNRVEPSDIAVAGFLARYREPTLSAYCRDLRCFWQWCADHELEPLAAKRPHLELYLRELEQRGCAPATVSHRLSTVAGMFKYAVINELVATNPTLAVTRPRVPWEGQRRTVLHPLEFAAVLGAARRHGETAHALSRCSACWGLRVSEACNARVTNLRYAGGYELLRVVAKGAKPAEIPLPIPVLRAVKAASEGRTHEPILRSVQGKSVTRGAASRLLGRGSAGSGRDQPGQPAHPAPDFLHRRSDQRRTAAGHAVRDAPRRRRTTIRYDLARANLDRHAAYSVAANLAGMAIGTKTLPGAAGTSKRSGVGYVAT